MIQQKPIVLIMAGGKGERFWPRSTAGHPKQLQKVYSDRTLLEETLIRARSITDKSRIYIGCNAQLKRAILKTHKGLPATNFVVEPEARNTAAIVVLAALTFEKKYPGAVHVILSADHYISPLKTFQQNMREAIETAKAGYLVTLGVRPNRPETGYGYIRVGASIAESAAFDIRSFIEKPDQKRALRYLNAGTYFWNSGMFVWSGAAILSEFRLHAPHILEPLEKGFKSAAALKKCFTDVPSEPVDKAIMEKSRRTAMIPADFTWDDVGSWVSLERICAADQAGNVLVSDDKRAQLAVHEASGNVVVSPQKLVALLGVRDVVVVEEKGVLFVTSREGLGKIKDMLAKFRENPSLQKYLE